ncbi:MAG: hypothetical protein JNL30_17280 [Rubrivivax sp.]|nr:hypothetical protein [Rubrivivax sp.]
MRRQPRNPRGSSAHRHGGPAAPAAWAALAAVVHTLALPLLPAAMPAPAFAQGEEARAQAQQRVQLAARLLTDAATAQRISASGDRRAIAHHDEGRLHQSMAEDALRRGDLADARRQADEAVRHLAAARRLVPDGMARQAAARQRHAAMLANLERLMEAWRQRAGPATTDDGDYFSAYGLMSTARQFAAEGRWEDGVHVLGAAERHVLDGMQRTLTSRELNYTQRAGSPAEELQFELQRHQALTGLLPLAVQELKPTPEAQALIDRYAQASRTLRSLALQRQRGGETAQALADIRNAMLYVQRALGAAGVATPAPSDASSAAEVGSTR